MRSWVTQSTSDRRRESSRGKSTAQYDGDLSWFAAFCLRMPFAKVWIFYLTTFLYRQSPAIMMQRLVFGGNKLKKATKLSKKKVSKVGDGRLVCRVAKKCNSAGGKAKTTSFVWTACWTFSYAGEHAGIEVPAEVQECRHAKRTGHREAVSLPCLGGFLALIRRGMKLICSIKQAYLRE